MPEPRPRPPEPRPAELRPAELLPAPAPGVAFREVPDGAVLYHPADETYFGLNPVGAELWALLPPANRWVEDAVATLALRYPEVAVERIRADVRELLDELAAAGLVCDATGPASGGADAGGGRGA